MPGPDRSPPLVPAGRLHWAGRGIDAATFAARVAQRSAELRPAAGERAGPSAAYDVTGLPVPDQLVAVFAAAAARVPVAVGRPGIPLPDLTAVPDGTFLIVSTSGSTSAPRAVTRTLGSWTRSFAPYTELAGLTAGDRLLPTGPLDSTLQLFAAVHALAVGAEVTDRSDAATAAVCVPAVLPRLLDLPQLRSVVVAGARLPDAVADRAMSTGLRVAEYYGAAELSFVAARRRPGPLRAFPGVQIDLRDGVLWSRSPYLASGYLGTPGGLRTDAEGFATVGDLAVGGPASLTVLGRGDAAISVGGRMVVAEEVEATLTGLDTVADVAVTGLPHPRLGQQLAALVVPAAGATVAAVRASARTVLHDEHLPRRWMPVAAVPRTAGGKIDRGAAARVAETAAAGPPR